MGTIIMRYVFTWLCKWLLKRGTQFNALKVAHKPFIAISLDEHERKFSAIKKTNKASVSSDLQQLVYLKSCGSDHLMVLTFSSRVTFLVDHSTTQDFFMLQNAVKAIDLELTFNINIV
ncbi:CLUMA_CG021589, isoform A [Clunio marinus]|uniref:CLUMA_CG021589, isoform A n=1 Tax=Clunio marinus TaxID=568069 RepID=A0A1J1J8E8_9DIPT|nr:CLUMA_CG021589, isoform A [Clunio marinus]